LNWRGLNSNPGRFRFVFLLSLFYSENRVCLSRGVQVAGAAWRAMTRIMTEVGDLVQRTRDGRTCQILGGWVIERSVGVVCGLHRARGDEERGFLGLASKPRSTVSDSLASKAAATVSGGLASKLITTISGGLASKPAATISIGFASKPVIGFLVEPQNQDGGGFSGLGLKIDSFGLGHKTDMRGSKSG
jgi:hypothetical protein